MKKFSDKNNMKNLVQLNDNNNNNWGDNNNNKNNTMKQYRISNNTKYSTR